MRSVYYCHLPERRLAEASGAATRMPKWIAGERVRFGVRFLDNYGGGLVPRDDLEASSWRVVLGWRDGRPKGGEMRLRVNGGVWCGAFHVGVGADVVEERLVALGVADAKAADMAGGGWWVWRTGGGEIVSLEGRSAKQTDPVMLVRVNGRDRGAENGGWIYEVRPVLAPVAYQGLVERVLPSPPYMTRIQAGGADSSGTFMWNEIQELTVPGAFRGAWQFQRGLARTDVLDTFSTADDIKAALDAMLAVEGGFVKVSAVGEEGALHIEFQGELRGMPLDLLEVNVYSAPPGDYTIDLDLDTAEMRSALRAGGGREVKLQLEAEVYLPVDPELPAGEKRWTKIFSEEVTVVAPVGWVGLAGLAEIDWLSPRARDYVPFTLSQVLTGQQQAFVAAVGDGLNETFELAHNFSTGLPWVTVRVNTEGGRQLRPDEYGVTFANGVVTLDFGDGANAYGVPAAAELMVAALAIGPESVFQAHTHAVEQILNLQDILDNIAQRLNALEAMLPRPGAASASDNAKPVDFQLPDIGELLPDVDFVETATTQASQVIVQPDRPNEPPTAPSGTEAAEAREREEAETQDRERDPDALPPNVIYRAAIFGIGKAASNPVPAVKNNAGDIIVPEIPAKESDPVVWPLRTNPTKWPLLLPAVEDASVTTTSTLPATPTWPGAVWQNTGTGELILPGGSGRKSQKVPINGFFASDGRAWYRVLREGSTSFYHALEMERELWRVFLGLEQFPVGASLKVSGEIRTRMVGEFFDDDARNLPRVDFAGSYILRADAVPVASAVNAGAVSARIVLGSTRLALSPSLKTMRWSLTMQREAVDACTSSWRTYSGAQNANFGAGAFALRMRLEAFDVDDSATDPRGQIALVMPSTKLEIKTA